MGERRQLGRSHASFDLAYLSSVGHPRVRKVVGVEISPDAIDDAGINAKINKITNAEFFVGKAEKRLKKILRNIPSLPDAASSVEAPAAADAATSSESVTTVTAAATNGVTDPSSIDRSSDVVAVVDPPRPGLHKDCIKAILKCHALKKLVYVSCNPTKALLDDVVELCRSPTQTDLQVRSNRRPACVRMWIS